MTLLDGLTLRIKDVYFDHGFYNNTCSGVLYAHNYLHVIPIKWGKTIQDKLSRGWSRVIEHKLVERVTSPTPSTARTDKADMGSTT